MIQYLVGLSWQQNMAERTLARSPGPRSFHSPPTSLLPSKELVFFRIWNYGLDTKERCLSQKRWWCFTLGKILNLHQPDPVSAIQHPAVESRSTTTALLWEDWVVFMCQISVIILACVALLTFQTPRWNHKEPAHDKKEGCWCPGPLQGYSFWSGVDIFTPIPLHHLPAQAASSWWDLELAWGFPRSGNCPPIIMIPHLSAENTCNRVDHPSNPLSFKWQKIFLSVKLHQVFSDSNFPPSVTKITNTYKVLTRLLSSAGVQQSIQTNTSQEGSSLYWGTGEAPACANHQQVERGDPSPLLSTGESSVPWSPVLSSQLQKGHGHTGGSETKIHEDATWMPHLERWRAHSLKTGRLRGDLIEVYKYQMRGCKTKWARPFSADPNERT